MVACGIGLAGAFSATSSGFNGADDATGVAEVAAFGTLGAEATPTPGGGATIGAAGAAVDVLGGTGAAGGGVDWIAPGGLSPAGGTGAAPSGFKGAGGLSPEGGMGAAPGGLGGIGADATGGTGVP